MSYQIKVILELHVYRLKDKYWPLPEFHKKARIYSDNKRNKRMNDHFILCNDPFYYFYFNCFLRFLIRVVLGFCFGFPSRVLFVSF